MRRSLLHIFAASLLIAAPAAHASVFSSSKASSDNTEKSNAPLSLMEEISSFLNTLPFSASATASEKTDDATTNNGCKEDKKTSSKKSAKKSSSGDDTEEEAKPTGPEPIYFGF